MLVFSAAPRSDIKELRQKTQVWNGVLNAAQVLRERARFVAAGSQTTPASLVVPCRSKVNRAVALAPSCGQSSIPVCAGITLVCTNKTELICDLRSVWSVWYVTWPWWWWLQPVLITHSSINIHAWTKTSTGVGWKCARMSFCCCCCCCLLLRGFGFFPYCFCFLFFLLFFLGSSDCLKNKQTSSWG